MLVEPMVAVMVCKEGRQESSCGGPATPVNTYQQSPLPCWQFLRAENRASCALFFPMHQYPAM